MCLITSTNSFVVFILFCVMFVDVVVSRVGGAAIEDLFSEILFLLVVQDSLSISNTWNNTFALFAAITA